MANFCPGCAASSGTWNRIRSINRVAPSGVRWRKNVHVAANSLGILEPSMAPDARTPAGTAPAAFALASAVTASARGSSACVSAASASDFIAQSAVILSST